jgi:hypothetical protein
LIHPSAGRLEGAACGGDRPIQPSDCRMERSQFLRTYGTPPSSMAIHYNHAQVKRERFVTRCHRRIVTASLLRL